MVSAQTAIAAGGEFRLVGLADSTHSSADVLMFCTDSSLAGWAAKFKDYFWPRGRFTTTARRDDGSEKTETLRLRIRAPLICAVIGANGDKSSRAVERGWGVAIEGWPYRCHVCLVGAKSACHF